MQPKTDSCRYVYYVQGKYLKFLGNMLQKNLVRATYGCVALGQLLGDHVTGHLLDLIGSLSDQIVRTFFVFLEVWQDDLVVHDGRSVVFDWHHAPDEEDALQQPVEGNNLHQEEGEVLEHRQDTVDDPVGEPSGVVLLCAGFDRFHGNVRRISHSNGVTQDLCGIAEGQIENHNGNTTQENVHPRDAGFLFGQLERLGPWFAFVLQGRFDGCSHFVDFVGHFSAGADNM